jgi:hypothetical protein
VRLALKVVMQNDRDFVDVIYRYYFLSLFLLSSPHLLSTTFICILLPFALHNSDFRV